MEQKVLIPSDISQPGKDYLRERGYVIKMGRGIDEQTIMEDAADCDALLARNEHITRGIMEAAPHLKVISKHGVGLDKIDLDAARDLNIWVTNGPLSNTVAVAEHTMMLILACAKKLVLFDKAIRNGDYEIRNRVKGMDLEGKTLGLLGLGKIGHMVAKKAINGFGMKVLDMTPSCRRTGGTRRSGAVRPWRRSSPAAISCPSTCPPHRRPATAWTHG